VDNSAGITASLTASLQGRYASALFELASEQNVAAAVEGDLAQLGEALTASEDLGALIRNPQIARSDAARAVDAVAESLGAHQVTKNFLGVLSANRRLAALPQIISAYATIAAASRGEVTAQVTSAHPLSADQLKALGAKLRQREGKDIKIDATVDPELLGGLVVRIGSQQIDSSIRTRLNSLAQEIRG